MRRRKRADWPLSVYQYWVRLEYPTWTHLPEGAKQEIDALRALWNQLVEVFEQRQVTYREIVSRPPQNAEAQDPSETVRLALHNLQQAFLAEARRLTGACSASWAGREWTLDQFLAATTRFFKKHSGPPKQKLGPPQEVHFQHRFTSGGLPVERIFGRSQRLHLEPVSSEAFNPLLPQRQRKRLARTRGKFQAGTATLAFHALLHRPLPAGAYLKAAALIGRQVVRSGYHCHPEGGHRTPPRWVWSLQLTIEVPPTVMPAERAKKPVAALHVQPQVWSSGQLRIGMLIDSTGREEALFLPEDVLASWRYKRRLQGQADQLLAETKRRLRCLPRPTQLSSATLSLFDQLRTARAPGLWRLLQLLEETGATGEMLEILQHWADHSTKLWREARGLEQHYLGHRNWFYRNVVSQLCRRYQRLIVTTLDTQAFPLERQEKGESPANEAATYRQLASPSRFLVFLQQAAIKTGTEIKRESLSQYQVGLTQSSGPFETQFSGEKAETIAKSQRSLWPLS
ncbi:MAG TPA: hypothetical protein VGX03_08970 [Candidatus Binatia bacterium]|jgi:hypothetical protein|nr:hypothetical protein [Candidatus Binatia bacterium]